MRPQLSLEDVVGNYSSWDRPGDFQSYVLESPALSESERLLFKSAWDEAMHERHWTLPDLRKCAELAEGLLRQGFPDFSPKTISAIANAASYLWR